MSIFLRDNTMNKQARYFKFASFASEESELIANPSSLSLESLPQLVKDIKRSSTGNPIGITDAYSCTKKFFSEAKAVGIKPKLIVMGHSSGGRSMVKFLEYLKKKDSSIKADLAISIDPVKEAQHVMSEVSGKIMDNVSRDILDTFTPFDINNKKIKVSSKKQPKSLYKTSNTKRWVSFYQRDDTIGLGGDITFGIHGSPIHNADKNYYEDNLGDKGHGAITYKSTVLDKIKNEVLNLFK